MQALKRKITNDSLINPNNVLLFGGGNFVRAFIGWIIEEFNQQNENKLGVSVVKVTPGDYTSWRNQDGLYHVNTKGIDSGNLIDKSDLISCVNEIISTSDEWDKFIDTAKDPNYKFLISNTTESGLKYSEESLESNKGAKEFPGKLTQWLYARYTHFEGDTDKGCIFLPCELLIDNGDLLHSLLNQYIALWNLGEDFKNWISSSCVFCNTLVDRIVPGISTDNLANACKSFGYEDQLATEGEPYHFFAIEAPNEVRDILPIDKIGLNIVYTDNLNPYRLQKVRILNGAHSSMVPVGLLYGVDTVGEVMADEILEKYVVDVVNQEIIPATDMPKDDLTKYANQIMDRFRNPFIKHKLISIALNSFSKYKSRILPSLLDYYRSFGKLPQRLVLPFACMLRLYRGDINGEKIVLKDDPQILERMKQFWLLVDADKNALREAVREISSDEKLWGQDLTIIEGFVDTTLDYLTKIETVGVSEILKKI